MRAYKIGKHRYCLVDENKSDECYRRRKEIGEWGGHFNRATKRWECSYECAVVLGAEFMYHVKIQMPDNIETTTLATEEDIEKGFVKELFWEDHVNAKILEVLGEAEL